MLHDTTIIAHRTEGGEEQSLYDHVEGVALQIRRNLCLDVTVVVSFPIFLRNFSQAIVPLYLNMKPIISIIIPFFVVQIAGHNILNIQSPRSRY